MTDQKQAFQPRQRKFTALRKETHYPKAERMPMGELNRHYARMCRVGNVDLWETLFAIAWITLIGAIAGGVVTDSLSKSAAFVMGGFALVCFAAWYAVRDTEAETVKAIREDFKADILDTFELIEIIEDTAELEVDQRQESP
jgi:hypothetical protein